MRPGCYIEDLSSPGNTTDPPGRPATQANRSAVAGMLPVVRGNYRTGRRICLPQGDLRFDQSVTAIRRIDTTLPSRMAGQFSDDFQKFERFLPVTGIAVWHDTVEIGKIEPLGLGFVQQSCEFCASLAACPADTASFSAMISRDNNCRRGGESRAVDPVPRRRLVPRLQGSRVRPRHIADWRYRRQQNRCAAGRPEKCLPNERQARRVGINT